MEPLNRQKILQENPNITEADLEEYEQLLGRKFNELPLNPDEIDRVFELFHKIWPINDIVARADKVTNND